MPNHDLLSLKARYLAPTSEEFVVFYRTFYDHFPAAYRTHCPAVQCVARPQQIIVEELRENSISPSQALISLRDGRGEPVYIRRLLLERTRSFILTARRAAVWAVKSLLRNAWHRSHAEKTGSLY